MCVRSGCCSSEVHAFKQLVFNRPRNKIVVTVDSIDCSCWKHISFKRNWLDKENTSGEFGNRGVSSQSNYIIELLLNISYFLYGCTVILHLARCWEHDSANPFLRQKFTKLYHPKHPNPRNQMCKCQMSMSDVQTKPHTASYRNAIWYSLIHFDICEYH